MWPRRNAAELNTVKQPSVWKMFKKTQEEIIKMNKDKREAVKKGKVLEIDLFIKKLGIEKFDPELFHYNNNEQ